MFSVAGEGSRRTMLITVSCYHERAELRRACRHQKLKASRKALVSECQGRERFCRHKTVLVCSWINLQALDCSFPFSYVLNLKDRLNCAGLDLGKPAMTILVLEKRMRFMERPALLIGCSYMLLYFFVINNYYYLLC